MVGTQSSSEPDRFPALKLEFIVFVMRAMCELLRGNIWDFSGGSCLQPPSKALVVVYTVVYSAEKSNHLLLTLCSPCVK